MKKVLYSLIIVLIISFWLPQNVFAADNDPQQAEIIRFDDGSYMLIEIESVDTWSARSKTGSASYTFYNESDTAMWKATLTGTFTYDGTSSTCTAASTSVAVYNSAWSVGAKSASRSGNTATGNFTMVVTGLFDVTLDVPVTITLTCDKNGKLS